MAVTTYTVQRGDSLWKIASKHKSSISGNTINAKIDTLVALNGIKNKNLIYVGQVLKLSGSADGQSSSSSTANNSNCVVIHSFGLQSESSTGRDVFAIWSWHKISDNFKNFKVRWEWDSPDSANDGKYITHFQETETTDTWATFSIPEEFQKTVNWVQIFITPIANNKTNSKGEETNTPYWTADQTGKQYKFADNPPLQPEIPSVSINKETLVLTASISNIVASELDAVGVKFNIVQDNTINIHTSDSVTINTESNHVSYQYSVEPGHSYTVRACSVGANGKTSGWSDFSESVGTKPSAPSAITTYRRNKRTDGVIAAYLEWASVTNATSYKIEYVTVESDFETTPGNIQSVTTENARTSLEIILDSTGYDYFFRIRAVNNDGESDPTDVVKIPIGSPPAAPTTYSSSESAFVGDTMELNWIHNPTDNSAQSYAELSLKINDNDWISYVLENTTDANNTGDRIDEANYKYGTSVSYKGDLYFKMDTTHADLKNAKIQWKVRTAGVTDQFSDTDWSVERTIYIYEKPTLNLSMTSDLAGVGPLITTLTSFPFYIRSQLSLTDYNIQRPVGYHLRIVSNEYYVTVDDVGRTKIINPGDAVYSKYFDTSETLIVEMSANNLDLESGIGYTAYLSVDMSTGLSVDNQHEFTVSWVDVEYAINANISVDKETYTALITPYCREKIPVPGGKNLFNVDSAGLIEVNAAGVQRYGIKFSTPGTYTFSGNAPSGFAYKIITDGVYGEYRTYVGNTQFTVTISDNQEFIIYQGEEGIPLNYQLTNAMLELGSEATEYEEYYEVYEDGGLVENVTLSVYRREFDGTYKKIASSIPNNYTAVTDPHPSLDYARYRFTATDTQTGALSFWDMAGYPVEGSAVIIQWDEEWSTFDIGETTSVDGPSWSGSLLKLPYNIKVTDNRKREVALQTYAGREHPVTYYGTQIDEAPQWSTDIPKTDKETIYALRRLSLWSGDVYIREPSGMGYWANVGVSFNQSYDEVKIPVTLNITRVEGGV